MNRPPSRELYPKQQWIKKPNYGHLTLNLKDLINEIPVLYPHIYSLVIIQNGYLVYENYYHGFSSQSLFQGNCVFKSFLSAIMGRLLQEKQLKTLDIPFLDYFQEEIKNKKLDPEYFKITLRHLMQKTSGILWPPPEKKFPHLTEDKALDLILSLKINHKPGTRFEYKPDPHIIYYVIEKITGQSFGAAADELLFKPLNIRDYSWNTDFFTPEFLSMKAADFARLGHLYLRKGWWQGKQLIPEWFIRESTASGIPAAAHGIENRLYGLLWWVRESGNFKGYHAGGFGGQYIVVIPEIDAVIVTCSETTRPHIENKRLIQKLADHLRSDTLMAKSKKTNTLLSDQERNVAIQKIQEYFSYERDEDLGMIAADNLLEFFMNNIGKDIAKKLINRYRDKLITKIDDAEVEVLDILE